MGLSPIPTDRNRIHPVSDAASTSSSMVSLSPSQLETALMDTLGLNVASGIRGKCNANPITSSGKKIQLVRILGVASVPIAILFCLCGAIFTMKVETYSGTKEVHDMIGFSIQLCETIHVLQKERDRSSLYVSLIGDDLKNRLILQYVETDEAVRRFFSKPTNKQESVISRDELILLLSSHRYQLELSNATQQKEMEFYSEIINLLQDQFLESISEASTGIVWKLLVALNEVMTAKELFGIERGYGSLYFSRGGFRSNDEYLYFADAQDVANISLFAARQYSEEIEEIYLNTVAGKEVFINTIRDKRFMVRYDPFGGNIGVGSAENATNWYDNMSLYIDSLLEMQNELIATIQVILDREMDTEVTVLAVLGTTIAVVMAVSPVILLSVFRVTKELQKFSGNLLDKTRELNAEKRRTNSLLYSLLPKHLAHQLKHNNHVQAESFDEATVLFSDIEGFTKISANSSPIQIVEMLDVLYTCFDASIDKFDVYKVETIGDAYMVVSGVPMRNGRKHAGEIAKLSLHLLHKIRKLVVPHQPQTRLKLRIGVHSGPVVAGVVNQKMPRYCLFGETVTCASRMEANGRAGKVHISATTEAILSENGGFVISPRVEPMEEDLGFQTYWLTAISADADFGDLECDRSTTSSPSKESGFTSSYLSSGSDAHSRATSSLTVSTIPESQSEDTSSC